MSSEPTTIDTRGSIIGRIRGSPARRRYWLLVLVMLVTGAIIVAAILDDSGGQSLGSFYPAVGATVLLQAHGTGSKVLSVASVTLPSNPNSHSSKQTTFEKALPDSKISLSASCFGNRQYLRIKVQPGNESLQPMCYPTGGGATVVDGPYKFPYPKRVIIKAPADVSWKFILVEPGTLNSGIAIAP